jgi:glucose/arabinose dehydrogenase
MAVSPSGDLYVMIRREQDGPGGGVVTLRDADGDGRFEQQQRFATGLNGTAVAWRDGSLYVGADTRIVGFKMDGKSLDVKGRIWKITYAGN